MLCLRFEDDKTARLEIKTDTEEILNDIKVLLDRRFTLKPDEDGIRTDIRGIIKIDFVNELLVVLFEPG